MIRCAAPPQHWDGAVSHNSHHGAGKACRGRGKACSADKAAPRNEGRARLGDVNRYATEITHLYRQSQEAQRQKLETSLAIGRLLVKAKAELRHGQYQHMIKHLLPFDDRHARRLRAAAEHDILGKMDT